MAKICHYEGAPKTAISNAIPLCSGATKVCGSRLAISLGIRLLRREIATVAMGLFTNEIDCTAPSQ